MDVNTVNLILWAPFAVVGLLAALVYCIKGLRKGVKPSLVSLAAIFAATGLGIVIARFLAGMAAPAVRGMLGSDLFADAGASADMLEQLLFSVIHTLVAMVLFMLLFLVLTPVIAAIGKAIVRKKSEDAPISGGSRAGGAAVGLVSACLFALVLLLPLYGSLAAYAPVVRGVLDMIPEESTSAAQETPKVRMLSAGAVPVDEPAVPAPSGRQLLEQLLDCILQHPLVELSSSAPVREVYNSLSQVSTEQAPVNFAQMAGTMEKLMDKAAAVARADGDNRTAACRELVDFCRKEVLSQDWAYTVYAMAMEEVPGLLPADQAVVREALEILNMDEEAFRANVDALLDFADVLLEQEVLDQLEQDSYETLMSGALPAAAGTLLNATRQIVELKNLSYRAALEEAAGDMGRIFARGYPLERLTDPEQQKQEVEALCILAGLVEDADPADFFLRHPCLGKEAFQAWSVIAGRPAE